MLPNGSGPPLKMLATTQKVLATERMRKDLKHSSKSTDQIPGNYLAKQRRQKHDSSKLVFPEHKQPKCNAEMYKTNYYMNFNAKPKCRPPSPRPCSPTRRNNPHPSKKFLTWKIPTRVFNYGLSKNANTSFLTSNMNDTFLSFYDDYKGRKDYLDEVNTKLLLELTKTYSAPDFDARKRNRRKRASVELRIPTDASQGELSLPSLLRKSWSPKKSSIEQPQKQKKSNISPLFIKPEFQPLFQSWYDTASSGVKEKAAKTVAHLEENYIQKALESALKPDAIEAIEDWLLTADEEEREIAMQFIQTILLHSFEENKAEMIASSGVEGVASDERERQQFTPPSTPPPTPVGGKKTPTPTKQSHHHHHNKKMGCEVCARKELESALQQLQAIASSPEMKAPDIAELLNPLHPGVIAKKESQKRFVFGKRTFARPKKQQTVNKGSLFMSSTKPKGRNFTIHPEWY